MTGAAFPGFLIAGAVFAAVPVALHFLARRPPARAALPTARFLTEDPRTLLRLQRTPTDPWLLVVRVVFALALGAAFAGLSWTPGRSGAARVVLVDAGADPTVPWPEAVDAVRGAGEADAGAGVEGRSEAGDGGAAIVVAYGLDEGPRVVDFDELPGLERGSRPATVEDGLRALRGLARGEGFQEAEVVWVGRPSWRAWSPGLGLIRARLWPGRVEMRPLGGGNPEDGSAETRVEDVSAEMRGGNVSAETRADAPVTPVALLIGEAADGSIGRAVEALGGRVVGAAGEVSGAAGEVSGSAGGGTVAPPPDWVFAADAPSGSLGSLLDRARSGATVVLAGPLTEPRDAVPWVTSAPSGLASPRGTGSAAASGFAPSAPARLLLPGGRAAGSPVERLPGAPAAGARTVAIFDDGAPAAAAHPLGEGCVVYLAASLTAPTLTRSAEYPRLVRMLAQGCDHRGALDGPLDRGALTAIERPDLPATVDVGALIAAEGVPLTRWLVFLALALLGLEAAMTRERRA
jgi:hypothetical protein